MLRKIVVLLIFLNLAWWAWAQNWLAPLGLASVFAGEPERLTRQIRPEALRVQPVSPDAASVSASPPAPEAPAVPTAMPGVTTGIALEVAQSVAIPASAPAMPASALAFKASKARTRASAAKHASKNS